MLPGKYRLKKGRNFELLFDNGRYIKKEGLSLKYCSVEEVGEIKDRFGCNELKVGFVVGTKVSKKATVRNKKKRQMREVVRELIKQNKIKNGNIMVFVASKETVDSSYKDIKKDVEFLLKKADLYVGG